jgi:hypothetical protein
LTLAGALAAGFVSDLAAGLVLIFATLAAGFFALFTGLAGADFLDFAAGLAGLGFAIKIAGRERSGALIRENEARYIMAFPMGRKGKRDLFLSSLWAGLSSHFHELADE